MKCLRYLSLAFLLSTAGWAYAQSPTSKETQKFYGKITAQDRDSQTITVTNKRRKLVSQFSLNDQTTIVRKKKPLKVSELSIGQNLIIWYTEKNSKKTAQKITVRATPKKKPKKT